jgi:hypothetical protein
MQGKKKPGVLEQPCNPTILEAKAGRLKVQSQPGLHSENLSQKTTKQSCLLMLKHFCLKTHFLIKKSCKNGSCFTFKILYFDFNEIWEGKKFLQIFSFRSHVWLHVYNPALGNLRQVDWEFQASLGYAMRSWLWNRLSVSLKYIKQKLNEY